MKKINKAFLFVILISTTFSTLFIYVYASNTIASTNKSSYIPWQWIKDWYYDSAHNVWISYLPENRFSFIYWYSPWWTSIVKDNVTWLIWQSEKTNTVKLKNYEAKTYCNNLSQWWYTEWRMPNIKELQSILIYSDYNQGVDSNYFIQGNTPPYTISYWSSTIKASSTIRNWVITLPGSVIWGYQSISLTDVLCVHD